MLQSSLIAVDIGNARIKLGLFTGDCAKGLPEPIKTFSLQGDAWDGDALATWLGAEGSEPCHWRIASVNRPSATRLIDWLERYRPGDDIMLLASGDVSLEIRVERPDMVGVDRLVDAVAVNRLRPAGCPAVIVDVGSAITVDFVSSDGAFLGGAILPGIAMGARALHEFTDLLPLVDLSELTAPPSSLGKATAPAMESGLFWGAVGAIRQLIEQLPKDANDSIWRPLVFLTGGAGQSVAELLGPDARYVPNLTLAGIALAANPKKS